jgi:hypothetical protein
LAAFAADRLSANVARIRTIISTERVSVATEITEDQ